MHNYFSQVADGIKHLNDVSIDSKGVIYVTDSKQGKVYKVVNKVSSLAFEGIRNLNGIKAVGDKLYMAGGSVFVSENNAKPTKIADLQRGGQADLVQPRQRAHGGQAMPRCQHAGLYRLTVVASHALEQGLCGAEGRLRVHRWMILEAARCRHAQIARKRTITDG